MINSINVFDGRIHWNVSREISLGKVCLCYDYGLIHASRSCSWSVGTERNVAKIWLKSWHQLHKKYSRSKNLMHCDLISMRQNLIGRIFCCESAHDTAAYRLHNAQEPIEAQITLSSLAALIGIFVEIFAVNCERRKKSLLPFVDAFVTLRSASTWK